jgi:hypothetical protein
MTCTIPPRCKAPKFPKTPKGKDRANLWEFLQDRHNAQMSADLNHDFTKCWCCCADCIEPDKGSIWEILIRKFWELAG